MIVASTGWTFAEIDAAPAARLDALMEAIGAKATATSDAMKSAAETPMAATGGANVIRMPIPRDA
ncbi:MAG: hypothetical protein M3Y26_01345 [Actinomycetota bacterium]|nr:hypothetical protein [Actinomycetota bacterium]